MCEFFKVLSLDQIDLCQNARKINFLQKEIQIPDGVSDAVVSEIREILSGYENRMLKLIQDLISCDGSSSQYEKYLKSYNQMKVQSSNATPKFMYTIKFTFHSLGN